VIVAFASMVKTLRLGRILPKELCHTHLWVEMAVRNAAMRISQFTSVS